MNYLSVSEYYKRLFGRKIYKITLDAGCTCPNRDGTKDNRGCIFCSVTGSGDFASSRNLSVTEQIEEAKELVAAKINNLDNAKSNYIAYFQNFTNTYGDENSIINKYREALENSQIAGIAIGTRPDCLSDSMLKKIDTLSKTTFPDGPSNGQKYFSLELGLQTSSEQTAEYIRRHYTNNIYLDCIRRIKSVNPNIHIVTHIIFGLPGEDKNQMLDTVRFAINAGTDGIKIQVLNVLKGTDLEKDFSAGKFKTLEMTEYFELVKAALALVPENVVVHRLTGDGPKSLLVAPLWVADKKRVLNEMNKVLGRD